MINEKKELQQQLNVFAIIHCCELNCKNKAEFQIQDIGIDSTYEDYTHSCDKHLAEMIPDSSSCVIWRLSNNG